MRNNRIEGDPEGRRLARRRALQLAEAGKVARLLEALLKRADYNADQSVALIKDLAGYENSQLLKSYGRIEPRNRYKGHSPQPLQDSREISALYVDENGKSKPEPLASQAFFSLGAVAMTPQDVDAYKSAADNLKNEFFGRTDFTFHEPHMRNRDGIYYFGGDRSKQNAFDNALGSLIESTPFAAFGVGVRKQAYAAFVDADLDPYLPSDVYSLAIDLLMERYVDCLATNRQKAIGRVTFESQGPKEDAEHQLEYAHLLLDGTQWVPASAFRNWLETGLRFIPKSGSSAVELADMFSRDLYEWVRSECEIEPIRWELFNRKIYCRGDGLRGKFGVKVFPDSDIRDKIEAHRVQCGALIAN